MDFIVGLLRTQSGYDSILGDCGLTDQDSSLYTCQDYLLRTASSRVVYVKDSVSAWSAEEDCV
jgi:hypothetical protein